MSGDLEVLRRLLGLARPYRLWLLAAGAAACATVLASVALMTIAGWFIAAMAIAGATTGMMNYFAPAAGIRLFAIVRTGGRYVERLVSHDATFRLLTGLRIWLFGRLAPLAPADLEDQRGADLAAGLQADVETLQHAYLRLGSPLAVAVVCSVLVVAGLAVLHAGVALAVAAFLLTAGGLVPALTRRLATVSGAETVERRSALRVAVADFLQGAVDLRVAGAVERTLEGLEATSRQLTAAQERSASLAAVAEAAVGLCAGLAVMAAALIAVAGIAAGSLAPALAPALALAALAAFEAVAPLPAAVQRWGEVVAAARRVLAIADRSPRITEATDPSPLPADGRLVFRGVRLRYRPELRPALFDFDLDVASGERVAVVGPSGAGKSSIARLLLRFWDYEGEIALGGHDLRRYRPQDLRRLVGVAAQETHLFNGSIRDNLLMAAPAADEAAMRRALAAARLDDVVAGLTDGLDTWIGEGGARLSAGQARRLVLARTLLREPLVLVLDEPTENLDPTTARDLLATLSTAIGDRTTLLITHDPAVARAFADRIVRLEDGRRVA